MKNKMFEVIKQFANEGVQFVICGGVACILQGCDRTTYDLDLNIALDHTNLEKFINTAKIMKLQPRIPEPIENILNEENRQHWINEKNALVYTVLTESGDFQIDIFLVYPIPFIELYEKADPFEVGGVTILVSSKEDLITAKEKVNPLRDKDLYDIKQLKDLING